MDELYLINVLGGIKIFVSTVLGIFSAILLVYIIIILVNLFEEGKIDKDIKNPTFKFILPIFIISLFLTISIPSKNSMLSIYGFGTTIDYLQNSDDAKKLPDNAIKAMNTWLESITKEENVKEK